MKVKKTSFLEIVHKIYFHILDVGCCKIYIKKTLMSAFVHYGVEQAAKMKIQFSCICFYRFWISKGNSEEKSFLGLRKM